MKSPYDIIIKPIITEKSMMGMETNKYTFKVLKDANKTEIKLAVEEAFGVKVSKINTLNVKGKVKRQGKFIGKRADWKKAIITLTADSKPIELFEGM
ncbi:MAG: 50S ribosomal protein L23 [Clostridiales bacterium]|nr:50S ribosomal protein L23 [Clostridiales bacterium]